MGVRIQPAEAIESRSDEERGFSARLDAIMRHWSRNGRQISKPLKVTFICFFALTVISLTGLRLFSEYQHLTHRLEKTIETAKSFLSHQQKIGTDGLEKGLLGLSVNQQLIDAFKSDDPYALQQVTAHLFPEMTDLHQITEFSVYNSDKHRIISAHKAITRPDDQPNFLLGLAAETESVSRGLELGDNGTTTISAVRPWSVDGKFLGFLKLGMEIRRPLVFIGRTLQADVIEVHKTRSLIPGTAPADARNGWITFGNVAYRTVGDTELPPHIGPLVESDLDQLSRFDRIVFDNGAVKIAYSFPLLFANGASSSHLVLLQDITPQAKAFVLHTGISLLIAGLIAFAAWLVFNCLARNLQASVVKTRRKLEEEVEANTDALKHSQDRLVEAQKIASLGSWERDLQNGSLYWSNEMYRIAGLPLSLSSFEAREEFFKLIPPWQRMAVETELDQAILKCGQFNFEHQLIRKDGETRHLHVRGYVQAGEDGAAAKVFGTTHDVTEHHNSQERSKRLANILEASLNEIYIFDPKTLLYQHANQCARDNIGYSMEELADLPAWEVLGNNDEQLLRETLRPLLDGATSLLSLEGTHQRKDGSEYPVEVRIQLHETQNTSLLVAICNDVTERTARERETQAARHAAERIAYFDELTGLPNRAACQNDAAVAFAESNESKPAFIIHMDIDNFKRINDTLGHSAGDACLEETGERLRTCCIDLGKGYRWGGDEFVIIAVDSDADPEELCQRLNIVMRAPMEFEGNQIWPSVSLGVACCPNDGEDFATLLVHADLALYRSKDDGKDRWSYFTSDMKIDSDEEARMEQELRHALRRDEFFLVFQPQVNIRTQQVTGIEALVRWQHPTRGMLGPGSFLPIVEKTSLAAPLGQVVIDKALEAASIWQASQLDFGRIAVNLSPSHLTSGTLLDDFNNAMAKHGVLPEFITAEVLESVFLDSERSNNSEVLEELHNLGVHIELDDFGTGYASLSHVADLPINGLKIDRSFTAQILTDAKKEIVVNHLIHLARSLDIDIVCEGVETDSQFDRLRMMGNFSVQGYLIARPMPFENISNWLTSAQADLSFGLA
ncbi:putative bifunctional diguanylate cyclase/phosphodiesterase [Roseibium polysiphoniae]|uniref:putative bifunctional diguanylate cyclase/phosphodiesterase n=1 Tax=Roseibium polysiphoniae TaxID=2571221 RepID=UPI001BCE726D